MIDEMAFKITSEVGSELSNMDFHETHSIVCTKGESKGFIEYY